jgi:hypothetical protein
MEDRMKDLVKRRKDIQDLGTFLTTFMEKIEDKSARNENTMRLSALRNAIAMRGRQEREDVFADYEAFSEELAARTLKKAKEVAERDMDGAGDDAAAQAVKKGEGPK